MLGAAITPLPGLGANMRRPERVTQIGRDLVLASNFSLSVARLPASIVSYRVVYAPGLLARIILTHADGTKETRYLEPIKGGKLMRPAAGIPCPQRDKHGQVI